MDSARIREWLARASQFTAEAHTVLGITEASKSRIILLDVSYTRLASLSVQQDDLLRQALRCVEHELFRAAHVMAWAALMDFIEEKLASDGLVSVQRARPKWPAVTIEELREHINEFQLVDVAHVVGLCTKNQAKALHGLLNKRNECAHPSAYYPTLNETLGYVSEILQRIEQIRARSI